MSAATTGVRDLAAAARSGRGWRRLGLAAMVCSLAGCAGIDPYARVPIAAHLARDDAVGDCARLFRQVDQRIDALGVRDAQAPRVPGFPYLRVDRFTASLAAAAPQSAAGASWRAMMGELDRRDRRVEFANAGADGGPAAAALDDCRERLARTDTDAAESLLQAAQVPDAYRPAARVLGLYPLTRIAFAAAIRGWQRRTQATFDALAQAPPHALTGQRYSASPDDAVLPDPPPNAVPGGPPGLPRIAPAQWRTLLHRHAPRLQVETASDDDRIGAPVWRAHGGGDAPVATVDTGRPTVYTRIALTHLGGRVQVQLIYTAWFPRRSAEHRLDLLAGALDGLVWRVTLGDDLEPLVYDTIHPCGCYHLFIPTLRVRARPPPIDADPLDEAMFAPVTLRAPGPDERITLHLSSRNHHLKQVTVAPAQDHADASVRYRLRSDDELRTLPWPSAGAGRTRSLYGPDGLVPGSQRLERFLFWPMGIASAGQMRQWGHHATAFVGRRHFDDPWLLDRYFEPVPQAPGDAAPAP